jgi:hypothetical protein
MKFVEHKVEILQTPPENVFVVEHLGCNLGVIYHKNYHGNV